MNHNRLFLDRNLQIIFGITLIAVMGVSSVAPALPRISGNLNISEERVVLIIVVFTMPGIFLAPVLGILADRLNRRIIVIPSLFVFGIAGTLCAFTKNFTVLIALRFVQGIGAATLGSMNLTIIGDLFEGKRRISAMGYNSAVLSIGTLLYPSLGGLLANMDWSYPFLLSFLAIPVGIMVLLYLDNPVPESSENMGGYLKTALTLLLKKEILTLYFATLATFILLYAVLIAGFPFLMSSRFNADPGTIGMIISTASIATVLGSYNLGRLSRFISTKRLVTAGFLLYALSIFSTQFMGSLYLVIIPVLAYGFANGINIPSIQTRLSSSAPMEYRGAFMSLNSMVLRIGQTVGPLLAGMAFTRWQAGGIFYSAALFALVTGGIIAVMLRKNSPSH